MVSLLSLYLLTTRSQAQLMGATDELVEEQDIADGITESVMRQLLAVSTISELGGAGARSDFAAASDSMQSHLRRYLRRDLTPDERLQLERVREGHQKLEVTALRAIDFFSRGQTSEAETLRTNLAAQASSLLDATASFIAMRESSLRDFRERQTATLQAVQRTGGALMIVLLLGTLAVGRYLYRRVSHPLDELTAAASRVGAGDVGVRVLGAFDDEFAELAGAFNAMAASLEVASKSLESRNKELVTALTRVREAQAELLAAEKLGAMGRMTAGLAHQLNNPLASVLGFAELLDGRLAEDRDPTAAELREELVRPILQEARRTHDLIRSFLQFARPSAPGVSNVLVREALDVVVGLRTFAFQEAGLSIRIDDIPTVPVLAERQKLQEILLNLVNNAQEAMNGKPGGVLGIRGHTEDGFLVLAFEDDGPGMESPDLVFESLLYHQGGGPGHRPRPGPRPPVRGGVRGKRARCEPQGGRRRLHAPATRGGGSRGYGRGASEPRRPGGGPGDGALRPPGPDPGGGRRAAPPQSPAAHPG